MSDKKIIAVAGATGAQASGLVHSILKDKNGPYSVRALTRDPSSAKARALADAGAEVVAANVDDEESLKRAFDGAYGAYCVTFYWEHYSPDLEIQHGTALASACKATGVQHAIWSTFEDVRQYMADHDRRMPLLMDRFRVPHFDAKAEVDAVFRDLGVPTTFYLTSFYWENFIFFGSGPKKGPDGTYALTLPIGDKKMPSIAVEDLGKAAYGIFKAGKTLRRPDGWRRRRAPHGRADGGVDDEGAWRARRVQRRAARPLPELRVSRRGRPRQHVPVQGRLRRGILRTPAHRALEAAEPGAADVRSVAGEEREADSAGVALSICSAGL